MKPKRTSSALGSPISLQSGSSKRSRSDTQESLRTPVSQSTILSSKRASRLRQASPSISSNETITEKTEDTEIAERRSLRGFSDRDPYDILSSSEPPSAELSQSISSQAAVYMVCCCVPGDPINHLLEEMLGQDPRNDGLHSED